jgi:hypothetical protein
MMMKYHDFELILTSHGDNKVSVFYELENLSSDEPVEYEGKLSPENNIAVDIAELIEEGRNIAAVLFPTKQIQTRFRELWQEKGAIRLRLTYSGSDMDVEKLMGIPWEYVYLGKTKKEDKEDKYDYLLGIREDISIVHGLKQPAGATRLSAAVDRLKVEMKYFSYLDEADKRDDDTVNSVHKIFQNFIGEFGRLTTLFNCSNISNPEPSRIEAHPGVKAEEEDVMVALRTDHLIHLTGHGQTNAILLGDGRLTLNELLNTFRFTPKLNLKAVILLSCNSGDGHSIATALHKAGVPMVIGMTRTIHFGPAGNFVDGFYKALAAWPSAGLEKAIVNGRQSIFQEGVSRQQWHVGFGLPRLFLNSSDGVLIKEDHLFGSEEMVKHFRDYVDRVITKIKNSRTSTSNTEDYQKKLKEWLQEGLARWFFVSGKPGSGKSTQIVRFIHENSQLIYHFCFTDQPETGDPLTFIQYSLVPQLRQYFGEQYFDWCPRHKFPLLTGNAKDALIDFVYIPLSEAKQRGKEPPVIVIDGLDFIPPGHGFNNSILGLLYNHRDQLDQVARFLVSADVDEDNEWTKQILDTITELTHQVTPLDILPPFGISIPLFEEMVERFKLLFSEGDNASTNTLSLVEGALPQSLNKLYESALTIAKHARLHEGWEDKVQQFLDVITLAYEPLLPCDVAAIIDVKDDEMDKLLETLWPFLADRQKHHSLKLFHHSLRDYLRRDMQHQNRDMTAHKLFIEAFRPQGEWVKKPDWASLCGTEWQRRCAPNNCQDNTSKQNNLLTPGYVRRYLSYHAYECYRGTPRGDTEARREQARDFLKLICNPGFRTVRLVEVGRDAVVQDIRNALRVVYTEYALGCSDKEDNPAVEAIDRIMASNKFDLQNLEQQLRVDPKAGVPTLFEFLDLDPERWEEC